MGDDEEKLLDWSPMSSLAFPHMTDDDENTSAMCNTWMLPKGVTEIPEGVIFQNPLPPREGTLPVEMLVKSQRCRFSTVARGNACEIPKVSFFKILCPPGRERCPRKMLVTHARGGRTNSGQHMADDDEKTCGHLSPMMRFVDDDDEII